MSRVLKAGLWYFNWNVGRPFQADLVRTAWKGRPTFKTETRSATHERDIAGSESTPRRTRHDLRGFSEAQPGLVSHGRAHSFGSARPGQLCQYRGHCPE